MPIQRITCFRVKDEADIPQLLNQYKILAETNQKDGKRYILDVTARRTEPDARNQGYNVVAQTRFESMDDVRYYDTECEAHKRYKAFAKGKIEVPPLSIHLDI